MHLQNIHSNNGVILIVALIFLFISTLLGVTTLRGNVFNEKMTYNAIQREKALEAAEAALLEGERFVQNNSRAIISAVFTGQRDPLLGGQITVAAQKCEASVAGTAGVCGPMEMHANPTSQHENWVDVTSGGNKSSLNVWSKNNRHRKTNGNIRSAYQLISDPKFIVEFMGFIGGHKGTSNCKGLPSHQQELKNWPYCSLDRAQFRITALAQVGNHEETQVMLQSTYVKQ